MEHRKDLITTAARRGRGSLPIAASVISGLGAAIDSLAIVLSGTVTYLMFPRVSWAHYDLYAAAVLSIWISVLILFQLGGLYRFGALVRPWRQLDRIIVSFATAFLFLLAAAFAFKVSASFSRVWVSSFAVTALSVLIVLRLVFAAVVQRLARQGRLTRNLIIVGAERQVEGILARIDEIGLEFVNVTGIFLDRPATPLIGNHAVLGDIGQSEDFIRNYRVDDVVVALPWSEETQIAEQMLKLRDLPVNVYLGADLAGLKLNLDAPPSHFAKAPFFAVFGRPISGWGTAVKAIEDLVLALAILLALSPLLLLIALAIKLDSPGPVLFRQKRLGFNNQVFEIYKFRSMRHEAAAPERTIQAKKDDPRVTRIGRFLRRSSLDELPQLFNVLEGDMSLVGPRPHAVDHNEEYSKLIRGYFARHRVKPGITGWAQVHGLRGETDTQEKMEARVRHDTWYAEHWSLLLDLRILIMTAAVLFTGRNAH